jgi:hypothetical protein
LGSPGVTLHLFPCRKILREARKQLCVEELEHRWHRIFLPRDSFLRKKFNSGFDNVCKDRRLPTSTLVVQVGADIPEGISVYYGEFKR